MKLDPYLIPYTQFNSKWIRDLNMRTKTIKLLEVNMGLKSFVTLDLAIDLLNMTPKTQATKVKINKLNDIKIKNFCATKDAIHSKKATHRMGENICKLHIL